MEVKTDLKTIWILEDNVPKLIWEKDLTDDMIVLSLEGTKIDSELIENLKNQIREEKYDLYKSYVDEDPTIPEQDKEAIIQERLDNDLNKALIQIKNANNNINKMIAQSKALPVICNEIPIDEDKEILIDSLQYLPDFLQDKEVMMDASDLLNTLLKTKTEVDEQVEEARQAKIDSGIPEEDLPDRPDWTLMDQIHQAYTDTLYKISAYQKLSYNAKKELIKEKGLDYLLELLKYMYEEKYYNLTPAQQKAISVDDYLEQETEKTLSNITMLFNLLNFYKGTTLGLELILELVNCPDYLYLPWDIVAKYKGELDSLDELPIEDAQPGDTYQVRISDELTMYYIFNGVKWHQCSTYEDYLSPRENFTATLTIWDSASPRLQRRVIDFTRYYMLPYIDVQFKFTDSFDAVRAYPSGAISLFKCYNVYNYFVDGILHKKDLTHTVSDEWWRQATPFDYSEIDLGRPTYSERGFQGKIDLNNSYIEDTEGVKHYLYGQTKVIPSFITGEALNSLDYETDTISFNNDFVQAPLQQNFILVDITTGEQQNPYWEDDDTFVRDTVIQFSTCLTVGAIHNNKTVQEMEEIHIGDFDAVLGDHEVYAGRTTDLYASNIPNIYEATMEAKAEGLDHAGTMVCIEDPDNPPEVRETCGLEPELHFVFSDSFVNNNSMTGIGDLGILGSNSYYIYNGMLFNQEGRIGDGEDWKDIGASHAVSTTYFTPAIKGNNLVYIKDDVIDSIEMNTLDQQTTEATNWTHVTGYINEYYTAFAIADGKLYSLILQEGLPTYKILDDETGWTYITGCLYSSTYEAYGIKNGVMYRVGDGISPLTCDGQVITDWDDTIDCISRYHHSNRDYTTYAINNGLYAINADNVTKLDNGNWTAVCGYYDDTSPRTFGYGIKDGALYNLKGNTIELKDDTRVWTAISGCADTTVTFALGIADGKLYKFNAKNNSIEEIGNGTGWTKVFGRYTTSTSASSDCYSYGIKNNKFYTLHKGDMQGTGGCWKLNGEGASINLEDYNIVDIKVKNGDNEHIGMENIRVNAPFGDEPEGQELTNYDIYVAYDTWGFENNSRYLIRTEMSDLKNTYINPEAQEGGRYGVKLHDVTFDESTSYISDFVKCPMILHDGQTIRNDGRADGFDEENSYLEIPTYSDSYINEYGQRITYIRPFDKLTIKIGVRYGNELLPIILDEDKNQGIYYGTYNSEVGLFLKTSDYVLIKSGNVGTTEQVTIDFIKDENDNTYLVQIQDSSSTNTYIKCPKYLGGDGTNFCDGTVYLNESIMYVKVWEYEKHWRDEQDPPFVDKVIPMYDRNGYISIDSLGTEVDMHFITGTSQEHRKIIKITDNNEHLENDDPAVVELYMDVLYESRTHENSDNLEVNDDFCYNTLNIGEQEGITTSTLVYSGSYELDPQKGYSVGHLSSSYAKNGIAKDFNSEDYLKLNSQLDEVLEIKTGEIEGRQVLFRTEEDEAYTNDYLLTADISANFSRPIGHTDPSGDIFELHTNVPGTQTKQLVFNNEAFSLDYTKILEAEDNYTFDDYEATLSDFIIHTEDEDDNPITITDAFCVIPLQLNETSRTVNPDTGIEDFEYDAYPIFKIHMNSTHKQKLASLKQEEIFIGNTEIKYYDLEGHELDPDNLPEDPEEYTVEQVADPTLYPWQEDTDYYLKLKVDRHSEGFKNIRLSRQSASNPKDYFTIVNGVVGNFNKNNYLILDNATQKKGLRVSFRINDDGSRDQGLIGVPNGQSICIKDNKLTLCDNNGDVLETSNISLVNGERFDLYFKQGSIDSEQLLSSATIYYIDEDNEQKVPFENTIDIADEMWVGYASGGSGMLKFTGKVNLCTSYFESAEKEVFFKFLQTTTINISEDGVDYDTTYPIIVTNEEAIDELFFGYEFTGSLDCYNTLYQDGSCLLMPYELVWLDNKVDINKQIRAEKQAADPSYNPSADETVYTPVEYGIHITETPQRWDTVNITYTTVDHGYYMEPNTKYYLKYETVLDNDSGRHLETIVGNPNWLLGLVSGFSQNDYIEIPFDNESYKIIKCNTTAEDQVLCGYELTPEYICIKDGKWCYFDDTNFLEICDAEANEDFYIKLYSNLENIEYSRDGENWTVSNIEASFTGYDTFVIGKGYNTSLPAFKGSVDLTKSCIVNDSVNYIFTYYKKITPYISSNNIIWVPLVLNPLLTLKDTINVGEGLTGSLDLLHSNLIDPDSTYWIMNRISVYAAVDEPEGIPGIHAGDFIRYIYRDSYELSDDYTTQNETIKVNPEDLKLHIVGRPLVDNNIILTYNSWYMFRQFNTEYDFKLVPGNRTTLSWVNNDKEYIIYEMDNANYFVNIGYDYWGTISLKDSYRDQMMLCSYKEWYNYVIRYTKQDEENWRIWSRFEIEKATNVYQKTGFDLKGILYMDSSLIQMGNLITPFLARWDGNYVQIIGGVSLVDGIASQFTDEDYIRIIPDMLHNGMTLCLDVELDNNINNQGIATGLKIKDKFICDDTDTNLQRAYSKYKTSIEYAIKNGKVYIQLVGKNIINFEERKSGPRNLTIIPYNQNLNEGQIGYYVTSQEQADKLKFYYRIGDTNYDHYKENRDDWHEVDWVKVDSIDYTFGTIEDIYVTSIDFGFDENDQNLNPHGLTYLENDIVEYKIVTTEADPKVLRPLEDKIQQEIDVKTGYTELVQAVSDAETALEIAEQNVVSYENRVSRVTLYEGGYTSTSTIPRIYTYNSTNDSYTYQGYVMNTLQLQYACQVNGVTYTHIGKRNSGFNVGDTVTFLKEQYTMIRLNVVSRFVTNNQQGVITAIDNSTHTVKVEHLTAIEETDEYIELKTIRANANNKLNIAQSNLADYISSTLGLSYVQEDVTEEQIENAYDLRITEAETKRDNYLNGDKVNYNKTSLYQDKIEKQKTIF